ncbi:MAG: hypothetical protein FJ333_10790 [Sphingomonadales bacterium]|nr:hypothetical protein [Sphingomonadales bacterium]
MRLVREENYSIKKASLEVNEVKKNIVPRTTLNDRILANEPLLIPALGRPPEISKEVEASIVKCLKMCASYQYPMRKSDVQSLVQRYIISNSINTRWPDGLPGKDWCYLFLKRWRGEVKLKRPTNIRRTRSKVSPTIVKEFFQRIRPNLEGVPPSHIINYDETNLQVNYH